MIFGTILNYLNNKIDFYEKMMAFSRFFAFNNNEKSLPWIVLRGILFSPTDLIKKLQATSYKIDYKSDFQIVEAMNFWVQLFKKSIDNL